MLSNENTIIDLPALNRFKIGDEVVAEATDRIDRFEGVIVGIELRKVFSAHVLEPDITILHDGDQITDGFKPTDLRIVRPYLCEPEKDARVKALDEAALRIDCNCNERCLSQSDYCPKQNVAAIRALKDEVR